MFGNMTALEGLHVTPHPRTLQGAVSLANAIRLNTTLHTLKVADNDINEVGALKIAEVRNPTPPQPHIRKLTPP